MNLIQPTLLRENIYAIPVPEDADPDQPVISVGENGLPIILYYYKEKIDPIITVLPPGNWSILFPYPGCTEQQAAEVVERHLYPMTNDIMGWEDYSVEGQGFELFDNPVQSLFSLLRSKNLDTSKNYLLIQKNEG